MTQTVPVTGASSGIGKATIHVGPTPSAQGWFAGGERIGYDPGVGAIVPAQDAPLKIFLRRDGELAHAVSFLPGFPDGSLGWVKVQPHLPNAVTLVRRETVQRLV